MSSPEAHVLSGASSGLARARDKVDDRRRSVPVPSTGTIARPELRQRLDGASTSRLTVVSAGPGWGKSTVVAQWVATRRDIPAAWLTRLARVGPSASEPQPLIEPLTARELAVLAELPTMKSNSEIASKSYVSVNTVKTHLKGVYRKLDVSNRRDAVRRSRALGLIP